MYLPRRINIVSDLQIGSLACFAWRAGEQTSSYAVGTLHIGSSMEMISACNSYIGFHDGPGVLSFPP